MKHHYLSHILSFAAAVLLTVLVPPAAHSQNSWCSTASFSWTHNDTSPKTFTISSRDSAAYVLNTSACGHFLVQSGANSYSVSVTPWGMNPSQSDIVQYLSVTIDEGGSPVTETVVLRHLAAPAPPEPDPWDVVIADLPDTLSWIQRTTITSADGSSYYRDATFYDGLGYPLQEVLVGASPGGLKSIYTPVVYDNMRRADYRTYLPYAVATLNGVYDNAAIVNQNTFYKPNPNQDERPFAEKIYETSPIGRPVSIQREGMAWDAGGGHRTVLSYRTNTSADAVPRYRIAPGQSMASYVGVWPDSTLYCTQAVDEALDTVRTWTDAFGKTILTEAGTGKTLPGGGPEKARTLYIYDLRDSLTLVVQPEGLVALSTKTSKDISLSTDSGTNHDITDKWCFVRTYDGWGNVLSEHTPGGGTTQYAYDARNRLVLRTDGRMSPAETPSTRRMVLTLYDQYDRVTEERYVSSPYVTFEALRTFLRDTVSHTMDPAYIAYGLPASDTLRTAEYYPFTWESADYPSSGDGAFTPDMGIVTVSNLEKRRIKGFLRQETVHPTPDVEGHVPAGAPSVTRYYHYDSKGRVIQVNEAWSDGRTRRVSTKYSFTGDVLATKETVSVPVPEGGEGGGMTAVENSLASFYARDPRGRVLSCSRVLDGTDTLATVHYAYDDLGRLVGKTVGNSGNPVLNTNISYDLHGWTTGIDVTVNDGVGSSMDTVFSETLCYASPVKDAGAGRYDGNISETAFSHRVVPSSGSPYLKTNTWSYAYDGQKRLTDASHYPGAALTPSLADTERSIDYDCNGNITALKRYGNAGLENDLSFSHTGNRMISLVDANATGTDAGTKSFTYDANGNLTADGRKGLELRWNLLNLADSAAMHGSSLKYAWLSDGTLLSVRTDDGSGNGVRKRYMGSFVYTSNNGNSTDEPTEVESIAWDEGRIFCNVPAAVDSLEMPEGLEVGDPVIPDSLAVADTAVVDFAYRDCWFAGDHLGNVRSVVDITTDLVAPQILEQSDYLPFGTRIQNPVHASTMDNRWRYAGKEAQRFGTLDLGLLNFGARMYDPFTARWTAVDPLATKSINLSPWTYCSENPLNKYDPNGCYIEESSVEEWNNRKTDVESAIKSVQRLLQRLEARGRTNGKRYEDLNNRLQSLQATYSTINQLESSSQGYSLSNVDAGIGDVSYNPQTGIINISYLGNTGSFVHEVTHAGQFESGAIAFSLETGGTIAQDIYDELSAYRAEFYYNGRDVKTVTKEWLYDLHDTNGQKLYIPGGVANTAGIGITIYTPYFLAVKAYGGGSSTSWTPLFQMRGIHYKRK